MKFNYTCWQMEWVATIGGEVASKLAVESAKNYIENNFKEIEKDKESILQLIGSSMESKYAYDETKDEDVKAAKNAKDV